MIVIVIVIAVVVAVVVVTVAAVIAIAVAWPSSWGHEARTLPGHRLPPHEGGLHGLHAVGFASSLGAAPPALSRERAEALEPPAVSRRPESAAAPPAAGRGSLTN